MYSVTQIIKITKQPYRGYLPVDSLSRHLIKDDYILNEVENIAPSAVGLAVDYLTRLMLGESAEEAFRISLMGASVFSLKKHNDAFKKAKELARGIVGIDEQSIINACELVRYDVWFRNAKDAEKVNYDDVTPPNKQTIENIQIMVNRSLLFLKEYGPVVKYGFTFEPNGYSMKVSSGDGDFLTKDTLWDFKVSKHEPNSYQTLQLLMYWIMGKHSGQEIYNDIQFVGIYNPRLNVVYKYYMKLFDRKTIKEIEEKVICYDSGVKENTVKSEEQSTPQKSVHLTKTRELTSLQVGDRVLHKTFGLGTVKAIKPMNNDEMLTINFEKVGQKKLMNSFANLEKQQSE